MSGVLTGKLALVTGAGRGNGAAIARGLAASGARVVITDIDAATARATADTIDQAWPYSLDVTDDEACQKLASHIETEIGPLDILVNNAGIFLRGNLAAPDGRARWEQTLKVNVQGPFNVTMAFVDQLKRTRGTIVNVASINSFMAPAGSGAYPVSKGALAQFTRALATELAPDGVRVNAIAPGIINTAMTEVTRADSQRLSSFLNRVPMKRVGEPEELIGPVVFLCSDAASYVTGAVLPVDGGFLAG